MEDEEQEEVEGEDNVGEDKDDVEEEALVEGALESYNSDMLMDCCEETTWSRSKCQGMEMAISRI